MMRGKIISLAAVLVVLSIAFLLWDLRAPYGFILELRMTKLGALIVVGAATGMATVLFQTVAMNRLLTPGIVGFDALFVLMQTLLVAILGGVGAAQIAGPVRFGIETLVLMGAALALFGTLIRHGAGDMIRMILTGVILGVLLRGLASMVQRLLDPSEFAVVQGAVFASFGAVDPVLLITSGVILIAGMVVAFRMAPSLDVAGLGRQTARGLGLNHDRLVLGTLVLIAALVSVSTALVGPITFFGLLCASFARSLLNTHRHALLLPTAALIGALILVAGQFIFERVLARESALAMVIEVFGGLLFLILALRKART